MRMRRGQRGFYTPDRLIVLGIFGIVLAIAVPAYRDYGTRDEVRAFLGEAKHVFDAIEAFRNDKGVMPTNNQLLGYPDNLRTEVLSAIEVGDSGTVTVTFAEAIQGRSGLTLQLQPVHGESGVVWRCVGGTLKQSRRPRECVHSE